MPEHKLPTLSDLPSQTPPAPAPLPDDALLLSPVGDMAAPEPVGYWVRPIHPGTGQWTRRDHAFTRKGVTFQHGEAVIPARATIEFEGGTEGERPRRRLVDEFRDDLGYQVIPIPAGTPLLPSDDVARWQAQDALA